MDPIIYYIIMDDDPKAHGLLLTYFNHFPNFECRGCFTLATEAREFLLENPVHLLIADIQLPDMNGMEMIESLPKQPLVIFMTGHNSKKSATRGYTFDAVHYVTKPVSFCEFGTAIRRALDRLNGKPKTDNSISERLIFGTGATKEQVLLSEIRYIEAKRNNITIYLANETKVYLRQTLKDVVAMLPKTYFLQVHRSYIISLWQLRRVNANFVTFYGIDTIVPIGRKYRAELRARLGDDRSADRQRS